MDLNWASVMGLRVYLCPIYTESQQMGIAGRESVMRGFLYKNGI